jgi:hypothetical protein
MTKTYVREKIVFLTNGVGKTISTGRRLKLDPFLSVCEKINSKYIRDFNIRPENLKLLEENRKIP